MNATKPRILQYELPDGWTLLVGATAADNDILSTTIAAPEDWWFHVENVAGSHVILRAKANDQPSRETLCQAAAVAAYHSKARAAGTVSVYCTRARHVRKPRGVKTGTVEVSRGTILEVAPEISFAKRTRNELR